MYVPKKLKWTNLIDFKQFLEQETTEKVVFYNGWQLVTETTEYGIVDGVLYPVPKKEKVVEPPREIVKVPVTKKADVKVKSRKQILEEMRARGGKKISDKKKKSRR